MSKEFQKFKAEYDKKIKPKLATHGKKETKKKADRIGMAFSNMWEGEEVLKEGLVPAHEAGITGTNLSDYMKNKEFKSSYDAFKTSVEMFAKLMNDAIEHEKEALAVVAIANKLDADITKDLKKRKDKSQSKTDIEKLQNDVKAALKDLADAAKLHSGQNKMRQEYTGKFAKKVQAILKTPPGEALAQKNKTEMPQLLMDRKLNSNRNKIAKGYKTIKEKTDEALKIAETDLAAATAPLKLAAAELKSISGIAKSYEAALKNREVKNALEQSKDKAKLLKIIKTMLDAYADAERRVRGVMTTIKKAA